MPTRVKCPTCGTSVEWKTEHRFRPFCSERCQQIDLGAWSTGQYSIPVKDTDSWEQGDALPSPPLASERD